MTGRSGAKAMDRIEESEAWLTPRHDPDLDRSTRRDQTPAPPQGGVRGHCQRLGLRADARPDLSAPGADPGDERPDETILITTGTAGYLIGHARIGVNAEYRQRDAASTVAFRGYSRLRTGVSATYTF